MNAKPSEISDLVIRHFGSLYQISVKPLLCSPKSPNFLVVFVDGTLISASNLKEIRSVLKLLIGQNLVGKDYAYA